MKTSRCKEIERAIKRISPDFYVRMNGPIRQVWEKKFKYMTMDVDGHTLHVPVRDDYVVCSITDDWRAGGTPRDWGIDRIEQHLEAIHWKRYDQLRIERLKFEERQAESKKRDMENKFLDLADESYLAFKKGLSDINVANLNKDEKDKRLKEKRIKE